MKFTIEKLGRIKRAEFDIRPLTVLIGPNNTNKTWAAYVLYGQLLVFSRKLNVTQLATGLGEEGEKLFRESLSPLLDGLKEESAPARIELSLASPALLSPDKVVLNGGMSARAVSSILGVPEERVSDVHVGIQLSYSELATSVVLVDVSFERLLKRLQIKAYRSRRSPNGQTETSSSLVSLVSDSWTEDKIIRALNDQLTNLIENVVVFPAERNGVLPIWPLIPSYEELDIPLPVKDFGRFLAVAQAAPPVAVASSAQSHLLSLLKKVTGGEVAYSADAESKSLMFRSGAVEVPIHAAASLARAVAGLALYVERFFQPGDVLIIDELEMNAHPEAQLALTEFIAALVNAGIRVVFTTHSPYVVDHLNNLMEASRAPEDRREELARRFSLETPSSFISPDKVSVYAFQEQSPGGEVTVQDVLNRKTNLINWSTFSKVSEHITNLYSDILRTLEDES